MRLYHELFHQLNVGILGLSELCVSVNRVRDVLKYPVGEGTSFQGKQEFIFEAEMPIQVIELTAARIKENDKFGA